MRRFLCLALLAMSPAASATTVAGSAVVIDGDTVEISGKRIRLFGIDAPELSQSCDRNGERWACGQESADRLQSLIGDFTLSCDGNEVDVYGRLLAVCTLSGVDLNRIMVAEGWATAFRRYSQAYIGDETRARASKLGLWSSSFMAPEDYRLAEDAAGRRQVSARQVPSRAASSACDIKGNRGRNGWIYHLPGMRYYAETQAEELFCTEGEAQAAGYRRSRSG